MKAYPKDALSNRTKIIKGIEADENSKVTQMQEQIKQYEQQLQESTKLVQQQKEIVDKVVSVIKENNELKSFIATLYTEAKGKINEGNRQIQLGNQKIAETTKDATDFAQLIDGAIRGGQTNAMS